MPLELPAFCYSTSITQLIESEISMYDSSWLAVDIVPLTFWVFCGCDLLYLILIAKSCWENPNLIWAKYCCYSANEVHIADYLKHTLCNVLWINLFLWTEEFQTAAVHCRNSSSNWCDILCDGVTSILLCSTEIPPTPWKDQPAKSQNKADVPRCLIHFYAIFPNKGIWCY